MLSRTSLRLGALATAAIAALVLAPAALAGTISIGQPCFIATGIGQGADITLTGAGFTPGEEVFAQIPAPDGLLGYSEATVAPDGSLTATVADVSPETIDPVVEKRTMQIKGILSGAILAEAPFELTNLAVKTNPPTALPGHMVTYHFSGFSPGRPIFGHYLRHGKVVASQKFGKTKGACGALQVKAQLFPGRGSRNTSYGVQFDDSKKYSKKTGLKIVTKLTVF